MMILYLFLFAILGVALDLGNMEFLFWIFYGVTFVISLLIEIARMPENDEEDNENKEEINN